MNVPIPLLIVDAVLLLVFIVGWAEAALDGSYRLTFWRFLKAASLPLLIIAAGHFVAMSPWGQTLPNIFTYTFNLTDWLALAFIGIIRFVVFSIVLFLGLPFAILGLTTFVIRQFAPNSSGAVEKSMP